MVSFFLHLLETYISNLFILWRCDPAVTPLWFGLKSQLHTPSICIAPCPSGNSPNCYHRSLTLHCLVLFQLSSCDFSLVADPRHRRCLRSHLFQAWAYIHTITRRSALNISQKLQNYFPSPLFSINFSSKNESQWPSWYIQPDSMSIFLYTAVVFYSFLGFLNSSPMLFHLSTLPLLLASNFILVYPTYLYPFPNRLRLWIIK